MWAIAKHGSEGAYYGADTGYYVTKTRESILKLTLDTVLSDYYLSPKLAETGRGLPDTMKCEALASDADPVTYWTDTRLYETRDTLVIAPKRFSCDACGANAKKENVFIRLPEYLNVEPYLHPDSPQRDSAMGNIYQLYGVVQHAGNIRGGHYTANVRSLHDGQWYQTNDSHGIGQPLALEKVLNDPNAYVVFYKRAQGEPQATLWLEEWREHYAPRDEDVVDDSSSSDGGDVARSESDGEDVTMQDANGGNVPEHTPTPANSPDTRLAVSCIAGSRT